MQRRAPGVLGLWRVMPQIPLMGSRGVPLQTAVKVDVGDFQESGLEFFSAGVFPGFADDVVRFDARGRLPAGEALVRAALQWVREVEAVGRGVYQAPLEAYLTAVEEEAEEEKGRGGPRRQGGAGAAAGSPARARRRR